MTGQGGERTATKWPRNVAIIMDGNGRWARRRTMERIMGHQEGINSVREITTRCAELLLESLTLYAFSRENWKRPRAEVDALMDLLRRFLIDERPTITRHDIRLTAIGRLDELPAEVRYELDETIRMSASNRGMVLCLALSYGGRAEIADAARAIAARVRTGDVDPADVDEEMLAGHLYAPDLADPDLLIRTAGEMRVSNFLLWQISYSELWVTPVCWPEFRVEHLEEAFRAYAERERRFGTVPGGVG